MMLAGSIIPGNPVQVAVDLTGAQIAACTHALRTYRDEHYRLAEMSVDETLAMRDLTVLIDRFQELCDHGAHDTVELTAARLVRLSDAVRDFVAAQAETERMHPESRTHLAAAASLLDPLSDLASEALQVALRDLPELDEEPSGPDGRAGGAGPVGVR